MTSSIPRHLPAKKGRKRKERKEKGEGREKGKRKRGKEAHVALLGGGVFRVGTVCSRVGERVALSCGDVEGEGKGLKVRDSLQHCEHTPA